MEPHDPYVGRGIFGRKGSSKAEMVGVAPLLPFDAHTEPSGEYLETLLGRYDDNVWSADRVFASIEKGLEARGLLDRGYLVLTADHGEEFWDHHGWGHGNSLYEELVRVPLIFHGRGAAPRRVTSIARLIDVAPTLASLAGIDPPEGTAGINLLPVIFGEREETGIDFAYAELHRTRGKEAEMFLRSDGEKVIHVRSGGNEVVYLFNVLSDPAERNDLSPTEPERTAERLGELEEMMRRAREGRDEGAASTLDPVTEKRLRALGYMK